jgi:hypothetical protein
VSDPRLGRRVQFDEESRKYPVRALLGAALKPRSYTWSCPVWLDQGVEGACVGFSIAQEAAARPVSVPKITDAIGREIYHRARQLDQWPGEDYEGTSVLAGLKAAIERGWYGEYGEYRWAFGLQDLVLAVGYKGPAVIGVNWYDGMMDPDRDGFIHVTGSVAGQHCTVVRGVTITSVSPLNGWSRIRNSWGKAWGKTGDCFISFADLDRLLHEQGEAAIPLKRGPGSPTRQGT